MKKQFFAYKVGGVIVIFKIAVTHNGKLGKGLLICEQMSFAEKQFQILLEDKTDFSFYEHDREVCFNCIHSTSDGIGTCYTKNVNSLFSFQKTAKDFVNSGEIIYTPENFPWRKLIHAIRGLYVRFGTYGESIPFIPVERFRALIKSSRSYTAYTHQWNNYPEFAGLVQASTESVEESKIANEQGYKVFHVVEVMKPNGIKGIMCPEISGKTVCAFCGLCAGGKTNVFIPVHGNGKEKFIRTLY